MDLDFLVCFRYIAGGSGASAATLTSTNFVLGTKEGTLASVGILVGYVLNDGNSRNAATKFYLAPVAGWATSSANNDGTYMLPLLRVTGVFNTADMGTSGSMLSVFLDDKFNIGSATSTCSGEGATTCTVAVPA